MQQTRSEAEKWARSLAGTWGVLVLVTVLASAFGVFMIIWDESSHGDYLDGLGTGMALWGLVFVAPVLLVASIVLVSVRRGITRFRVDGTGWWLRRAARAALGVVVVLLAVPLVLSPGQVLPFWVWMAVPMGLLGLPAWGVLKTLPHDV